MRPLVRSLVVPLLSAWALPASAAVYGLPEPPTPAPTPQAWFNFSDDFLGLAVLNTDDYRTANITVGGSWGGWRFAADASMLTNRGRDDGTAPSRTDELTYSLGYAVLDRERDEKWRGLVTLGVGGRTYGDLGGESVQNRIHDTFGYKTVHLPYDPEEGTDGFVFYHARLTGVPSWEYQLSGPFGRWAVQIESGGLSSTGDEHQLYGAANLVSLGADSMAWVGARYQWHGGSYPTRTSQIVGDKESGWWLVVGLSRTPGVLVTASLNPDRETVAGTLGLTIDSAALPDGERGNGFRVDQALKFFPGGGNIGLDIRWQPAWLAERSLSGRDVLVLCYDFGAVAAYEDWQDCYVGFDQMVIGWGPSWDIPLFSRLAWSVGAYAAAGVRLERVHEEDGSPRFTDDQIHIAGVLQGELGTRLGWRFTDRGDSWLDQLRVGIGVDGWLPWPSATVSEGDDREDLMEPGFSAHLSLGVTVDW